MTLHEAVKSGTPKAVASALKGGLWRNAEDPNAKDSAGNPPLLYASRVEIAAALLDAGADVNGGKVGTPRDYRAVSPLFAAVARGDKAVAELLIDRGANINAVNTEEGISALYAVARSGKNDWVEFLLHHKANVNAHAYTQSAQTQANDTPLHAAARMGHIDVVRTLVAAPGVRLDAPNHPQGTTPLSAAAENGHAEIVDFLLKAGADIKKGRVLHRALLGPKDRDVVPLIAALLDAGADVHQNDSAWGTPLHLASHACIEIVRMLLAHGADVNAQMLNDGRTPLHDACHALASNAIDPVACVRELLQAGADPAAKNQQGYMPIEIVRGVRELNSNETAVVGRCEEALALLSAV